MSIEVSRLQDGSLCVSVRRFTQVVTRLAPGKILISGFGYNDGSVVSLTTRELDKELSQGGKISTFVNLLEESGNSSEAREAWASWTREHRASLESTHILFRSRMMEMAISIVSMLAGGGIETYSDPAKFVRAVAAQVPGFTRLPAFPDRPPRP